MKLKLFPCACQHPEHQLIFSYDEDFAYFDIGIKRVPNFFKRVYLAVKYVLGFECEFYLFEVVMDKESQEELKQELETENTFDE